jgi:phage/conjugal plasmid C-4 type zinc finger TraR family protein
VATGWAKEGAVQDQIDATVKDAVKRAQSNLPTGPGLSHCAECAGEIPAARRDAIPGVRLCITCQDNQDRDATRFSGINRRGDIFDSLLAL